MRYLVNSREMKRYDANTTEYFKIPSLLLMERAAVAAAEELKSRLSGGRVLIVCGTGNNGGDGLAVGRILKLSGINADLVLYGNRGKATEENKKQQEILAAYRFELSERIPEGIEYEMVVDAVFGVGLTRPIEGGYYDLIEYMNTLHGLKVALDIPSGVSADNGAILGTAFRADVTVTFAFEKAGLYLWPGCGAAGTVVLKEIGITEESFFGEKPAVCVLEDADLALLPKRPSHSNKGTFGHLLVIAGSPGMAGAAYLAAKSAYACGTGLVRIFTPEENRQILQTGLPEAVLTVYDAKNPDMAELERAMNWADAVLCGPGLGQTTAAMRLVEAVLHFAVSPVVFDADALNLIAKKRELFSQIRTETVITPHLGEFSRLTGEDISDIASAFLEKARETAEKYNIICVLKDEHTAVAVPGALTCLNLSGNSGMATAGSGDVLAGLLSGLLAQGIGGNLAAPLAVYLHGMAGDAAAEKTGEAGLMASDLIWGIRDVLADLEKTTCPETLSGLFS